MDLFQLITVSVVIISIFIGLTFFVFIAGHFYFKSKEKRINNFYKSEDVVVPLNRIVKYKVEMENEKRINHEYDTFSSFPEKLEKGTKELNKYKLDNSCTICNIYKVR